MRHLYFILAFVSCIHTCDNSDTQQSILREDHSFQILKERYPCEEFSGLRMLAISNDGSLSAWQGFAGPCNERFLHEKYVQIFLTDCKETDYYLVDKKIDWLEKTTIVNKTIFSEVNGKMNFEVDSLENGVWNIQHQNTPFYSHFCLNCQDNVVYFFRANGVVSKYSLTPFKELQSSKFSIPGNFVNDALLLDNNNLLCCVMLHGLYYFDWASSKARSLGKHYDSGFKKADNSNYLLAIFQKRGGGCWDYKRELRVLNVAKKTTKKRFLIEWSISDKHRRIAQFDFLPNQDDYFLVTYGGFKRGCSIYSFKNRAKIARIYTEGSIGKFWFPSEGIIALYLGDLKTQSINFPALIAEYNKQNENEKRRIVVGLKYPHLRCSVLS